MSNSKMRMNGIRKSSRAVEGGANGRSAKVAVAASQRAPKSSAARRFIEMPDAVKTAAVAEFDREFVADTFGAPPSAKRKVWQKVRRKMGRPKVGKGVKVFSLSMERDLLKQADAYRKAHGLSRAALVALGVRSVMAADAREIVAVV